MKVFLIFSLLLNFITPKLYSTIEWDADSLFNYTSTKIKNKEENLNYIIIDPDEILSENAKNITLTKMENFYHNKTVLNYIIIFYSMNKTITDLKTLVNIFSLKMQNEFKDYSNYRSIISAFAIDDEKSEIIVGQGSDFYLPATYRSEILNNTKIKIDLKNYDKAMEDLIDDIIKYYGLGVKEISGWVLMIILVVIIVIIGGCIVWCRMMGCNTRCCEVCFGCCIVMLGNCQKN